MLDREFRAGQVLTARDLNEIKAELKRLAKVTAVPPLNVSSGAGGFRMDLELRVPFAIKVTSGGTGGKYAWTAQVPTATGTWAAGTGSGTTSVDPAYEVNVNTTVAANTIILRAWRDPATNVLFFERGSC
jgi:hypothetical protein